MLVTASPLIATILNVMQKLTEGCHMSVAANLTVVTGDAAFTFVLTILKFTQNFLNFVNDVHPV